MSLLIDRLPDTVMIGGAEVRINSGFRTAVLFEQMMFDEDCPDSMKPGMALRLFYPVEPADIRGALNRLLWFYRCGKEPKLSKGGNGSRCYDFEYDDGYIYAAFLQQYGIDLTFAELHWWQFNALLNGLTDDCELVRIMGYRTIKISTDMSARERQFYSSMKRLYALPRSRSETEKLSEIEEMLMKKEV